MASGPAGGRDAKPGEALPQRLRGWRGAGMAALASAIAGGAAPSCQKISLVGNPGSAAAVKEVAAPREGLRILDK